MKHKRSEILENYAKIALDQGLISQAEAMTQEEKYRNKEWKDTIQALYGIKIDEEDILDRAHPKPVIVAPSYDKVNGLVENLKERQDIMVGIVRKPANGHLLNHKYASAKNNLVNELIRLGFMLDNGNIDDLRKLADSCSNRITKVAFLPAIPLAVKLGLGAVAFIASWSAIVNNTNPSDQGVLTNTERAIDYVKEALDEAPQIAGDLNKLLKDLNVLLSWARQYNNLSPVDVSTPEKFVETAENEQEKLNTAVKYKQACQIMIGRLDKYISTLTAVKPQTKSWGDWLDKLVDVYRMIDPDDLKDAANALITLKGSLVDSVQEAVSLMHAAKQKEPTLEAMLERHLNKEQEKPLEV